MGSGIRQSIDIGRGYKITTTRQIIGQWWFVKPAALHTNKVEIMFSVR